jgi:hypothetical protein
MTRRCKHTPPLSNLSHRVSRQDDDADDEHSEIPDTYDYRHINDKNAQFSSQRRTSKRFALRQLTPPCIQPHAPSGREVYIEIDDDYEEEQRTPEISRKKVWTLIMRQRFLYSNHYYSA